MQHTEDKQAGHVGKESGASRAGRADRAHRARKASRATRASKACKAGKAGKAHSASNPRKAGKVTSKAHNENNFPCAKATHRSGLEKSQITNFNVKQNHLTRIVPAKKC